MAGHSHWKQIKGHKGVADQKRGAVFSKLLKAISAAARTEPNPHFNPRLRTTIEKAREANVPRENIERAIARAKDQGTLEELVMEAYGPSGTAILIKAITDSRNRTVNEIKALLKDRNAKWADPGSVRWAFEEVSESHGGEWKAKFTQPLEEGDVPAFQALITSLEAHDDVQITYHNAVLPNALSKT